MANDKRDTALRYAGVGLAVFPCVPGQKRPLVEHGLREATTNPDIVRAWWSRWPDANVAMPTGQPGYDVVDVDVHPDGDGYRHLTALREAGLLDGWTHAVRTPSGGLHLYFLGSEQRNGKIVDAHIDFRGAGGYVLVPPSTIDRTGRAADYRTISTNSGTARTVDWAAIRTHLTPRRPQPASSAPAAGDVSPDRVVQWLARHVAQAREGNRNDALFWAACRAAEHGVTDPRPLRDAACQAGLGQHEATVTITSAYRTTNRDTNTPRPQSRREQQTPTSSPAAPAL